MGAGATSAGVVEAVHACTKDELKSILPSKGEDHAKLQSALEELSLAYGHGVDHTGRVFWNPEGRLRVIFEESDKDKNGTIDVDELKHAFQRDADMAQEYGLASFGKIESMDEVIGLFNAADHDRSGDLSWEEFLQLMTKLRNGEFKNMLRVRRNSRRTQTTGIKADPMLRDVKSSPRCNVQDWRVDYFRLDEEEQILLVLQTFKEKGCLTLMPVASSTLRNFIVKIRSRYNPCPYHNFLHALATLHYTFKILDVASENLGLEGLEPRDEFSLLVAALCHDVGHRGRNTTFEVLSLSPLALRYNDKSPLENHHCSVAFGVAIGPDADASCNIFKNLDHDLFRHIRQRMIAGILGTDMAFHNQHVKELKELETVEQLRDKDNGEFLIELLLHAADIGNPFMPPDISHQWGLKVAQEFTAQVEEERTMGLPVTSMMDGLTDLKKNAKSRVGFIDFVVTPLATPLFSLFPALVVPKQHLDENREAEKKRSE